MWQALQNYADNVRSRMSGQQPFEQGYGFQQMPYNFGQEYNPSLVDAFKRVKGVFQPQPYGFGGEKYLRNNMSQQEVMPTQQGANTPTPFGDVSARMANPYSANRMLQQTSPRIY